MESVIINRDCFDVSMLTVAIGWKPIERETGFFQKLIFDSQEEADIDLIAVLLDSNNKINKLGSDLHLTGDRKVPFQNGDIIYFHNLTAPSGNIGAYHQKKEKEIELIISDFINKGEYIIHTGDNLVGSNNSDAEKIFIFPDRLPNRVEKIIFIVSICNGVNNSFHFGKITDLYIRLIEKNDQQIVKYEFKEMEHKLINKYSIVFGEIDLSDNVIVFRKKIESFDHDNFVTILRNYI